VLQSQLRGAEEEIAKQRMELMGVISPGAPGLYETRQIQQLRDKIEYVMDSFRVRKF